MKSGPADNIACTQEAESLDRDRTTVIIVLAVGDLWLKGGVYPEKCLKMIGNNIFNFPHNHID